jgi:hypothetical protein
VQKDIDANTLRGDRHLYIILNTYISGGWGGGGDIIMIYNTICMHINERDGVGQ